MQLHGECGMKLEKNSTKNQHFYAHFIFPMCAHMTPEGKPLSAHNNGRVYASKPKSITVAILSRAAAEQNGKNLKCKLHSTWTLMYQMSTLRFSSLRTVKVKVMLMQKERQRVLIIAAINFYDVSRSCMKIIQSVSPLIYNS